MLGLHRGGAGSGKKLLHESTLGGFTTDKLGFFMPILAMSAGVVTAVWGSAFVRTPDGKLTPIRVGDKMKGGEQIVTEADGIVQISPLDGAVVTAKPAKPQAVDVDRALEALESPTDEEAPAAGLTGGAEGGFQPDRKSVV